MPDHPDQTTVQVDLGKRSYKIEIGPGQFAAIGAKLLPRLKRPRVFVLSDETVFGLHGAALQAILGKVGLDPKVLTVSPGESAKSWEGLQRVLHWLLDERAARDDTLIAFGGGVIGDLAGLAAALVKRGMGLVQVPTTLLAQVDSSVGGKTAINTSHGKNLIGAFNQPDLVIADTDLLKTLPDRERRAGYAEIVKYGFIDDSDFLDWLGTNGAAVLALEPEAISRAVATSCAAKARIVAADEREGGVRALLNFGHTFAHTLEAANGYSASLLHGEAVGTGMALALRYSARLGLMTRQDAERGAGLIRMGGLETELAQLDGGPYEAGALAEAMRQDKKVRAGRVPLILSRGLGRAFIHPDADLSDVATFLGEQLETAA